MKHESKMKLIFQLLENEITDFDTILTMINNNPSIPVEILLKELRR